MFPFHWSKVAPPGPELVAGTPCCCQEAGHRQILLVAQPFPPPTAPTPAVNSPVTNRRAVNLLVWHSVLLNRTASLKQVTAAVNKPVCLAAVSPKWSRGLEQ